MPDSQFTDTTDGVWSADRPSLALRMGVSNHELQMIVEYQHHHVERRRYRRLGCEHRQGSRALVDWYATTDVPRERWLFDPARAFDNVGPEPEFDQAILDDCRRCGSWCWLRTPPKNRMTRLQ